MFGGGGSNSRSMGGGGGTTTFVPGGKVSYVLKLPVYQAGEEEKKSKFHVELDP